MNHLPSAVVQSDLSVEGQLLTREKVAGKVLCIKKHKLKVSCTVFSKDLERRSFVIWASLKFFGHYNHLKKNVLIERRLHDGVNSSAVLIFPGESIYQIPYGPDVHPFQELLSPGAYASDGSYAVIKVHFITLVIS